MEHRPWRQFQTWTRRGLIGVLAVIGAAVGLAGSFTHRAWPPAGIALSLAALVALMMLVKAPARSRWSLGLVGAAWLIPVGVLAAGTAAGDVVIEGDPVGLTFFLGGTAIVSVFIGMGATPPRHGGHAPVPERTSVG